MPAIPPYLIDPAAWPPQLHTSEIGSFAHKTFAERIPQILQDAIDVNDYPDDIRRNLEALGAELRSGSIRMLAEDTPDRAFWDPATKPHLGHSWLDAPWFWAEAYFYRRVLEATRYFHPGPWQGVDPYRPVKQREWPPEIAPATANSLLAELPQDRDARFERLFHASLWGNRTDLSYNIAGHLGSTASKQDESDNLLADDTPQVWDYLQRPDVEHIILIADNVGTELLLDLALVDFLLDAGVVERITHHLKPQPYFVSDTMPEDLFDGLAALDNGGEQAQRLSQNIRRHLDRQRLELSTHWFYPTSLSYFQLPADLHAELAAADLVILKGDVNYRRLHGDAKWPYDTPFEHVTSYFPAPHVALRTCKGQHLLGVSPERQAQLWAEDEHWEVNGKRGVIQCRLVRG